MLAVGIALVAIAAWEMYVRSSGVAPSYNDDAPLWAFKRSQIYDAPEKSTYFIGASRIKFDLDISTWERLTGEKAVQLSLVGTSPQLVLKDLADDKNFTGKLIIDATEMIIFTKDPGDHFSAQKSIEYYNELSPSKRASFHINHLLESQFAFLETKVFSLNALLSRRLHLKSRNGMGGDVNFPVGFEPTTFQRQNFMSASFLEDTARHEVMKNYWKRFGLLKTTSDISQDTMQIILKDIRVNIDIIKARGGQVILVRPPSSGEMWEAENTAYPRKLYWDKILEYTNTEGIHFEDYPEMRNFICPEWSHLSQQDAVVFTKHLIKILQEKYSWKFNNIQTIALNKITR